MKIILLLLLSLVATIVLAPGVLSQEIEEKLDQARAKAATTRAAEFTDRFRKSGDIRPLMAEYFVNDFPRRLEFCRTTSNCEGSARDFWKGPGESDAVRFSPNDYLRHYTATINVMFLMSHIQGRIALAAGKKRGEYLEQSANILDKRLRGQLKKKDDWTLWGLFEFGLDGMKGVEAVRSFKNHILELEQAESALRKVKAEFRETDKDSEAQGSFSASYEKNAAAFFDFPAGTNLIRIWPPEEMLDLPYIIDMIEQKGRMHVVAVYPPID